MARSRALERSVVVLRALDVVLLLAGERARQPLKMQVELLGFMSQLQPLHFHTPGRTVLQSRQVFQRGCTNALHEGVQQASAPGVPRAPLPLPLPPAAGAALTASAWGRCTASWS